MLEIIILDSFSQSPFLVNCRSILIETSKYTLECHPVYWSDYLKETKDKKYLIYKINKIFEQRDSTCYLDLLRFYYSLILLE